MSAFDRTTDSSRTPRRVRNVPKAEISDSHRRLNIRPAKGAGHLLCPCRVVSLKGYVARLSCDAGHLLRAASCFIPFSKRSITADENFQTGPPIRPYLQSARCRFETRLRASGEQTRQRENVEPDEVLRVVWA